MNDGTLATIAGILVLGVLLSVLGVAAIYDSMNRECACVQTSEQK
jgi:hypothetical protein